MFGRILVLIMLIIMLFFIEPSIPMERTEGIENYDKIKILSEYGSDLDSALYLFPENTVGMIGPTYVSGMKTGLFDTDGYLILRTRYSEADYEAEVERLANTKCTVEGVETGVFYDVKSYALPAYVAVDGFDGVYEYALTDDKNYEITYVLLSYPEAMDLEEYENILKLNKAAYDVEDALSGFSIYVRDEHLEYEPSH